MTSPARGSAELSLITKREVAELLGRSERWVEQRSGRFRRVPLGVGKNGRPRIGFDINSLPPDAQKAWLEQQKQNVFELVASESSQPKQLTFPVVPAGPNLESADQKEAERRYQVIEPLIVPAKHHTLWLQCGNKKSAVLEFLANQHNITRRTIYRWLKAWDEGGLPALVDHDRSDKGIPRVLNTAALEFLMAAALPRQGAYGELSVREIHRAYEEERAWRASHVKKVLGEFEIRKYGRYVDGSGRLSPEAQLPPASYDTFRLWYSRIPEVVRVMARKGEEAFSNTQEILSFRNLAEIRPLDYVVMDHRRLDLFCMIQDRGGWKLARPWLTAAIDMRTRKWLAWVIVETPSSDSIASVLKRSFLDWGLPTALVWDNGKDFTCEWLEGRNTRSRKAAAVKELNPGMRGVLETLNVRIHHAIVRRARSKIIEPNFGNTANFDKTLPWWCGHKPQARPERFAELVTLHERWLKGEVAEAPFPTIERVAALYDNFLHSLNEREHTGEGMQKVTPTGRGWMAPNEAFEILIGKVERRTVPAEVLQFCFAKRRTVTVHSGEVRTTFAGRKYHYRLADSSVGLMALNGREVELAYDPLDLGSAALYCDGRFVGLLNCVELRRMGEETFVQDERDRRAARRQVKKFISAVHQQVHVPGPEERIARRQGVMPPRKEPARVEVPASLPAAVTDAAEAARVERQFSFAAAGTAGPDLIRQSDQNAYTDDDEFRFFQGE